ncbi:MAG: restriction endonuclease [Candidatus Thiodiazotropha taylori]|nr:restriction endonuclease [Candidatus Thiodiazotropha taylori]
MRVAVECKNYSRAVGIEVVNSFGSLVYLLKQRQLIDRAQLVASNGFTRQAREAASMHDIDLVEIDDLTAKVRTNKDAISHAEEALNNEYKDAAHSPSKQKKIFVVMPFAAEFEDVYILGIREVAEKLNLIVERADNVEHNKDILEIIQDRIQTCDVVVADTTNSNPNVFYEVGYAHGVEQPTILVCRKGETLPFDIQSKNIILYSSIVELRERLGKRLSNTVKRV